jgi:hypothetical protein
MRRWYPQILKYCEEGLLHLDSEIRTTTLDKARIFSVSDDEIPSMLESSITISPAERRPEPDDHVRMMFIIFRGE